MKIAVLVLLIIPLFLIGCSGVKISPQARPDELFQLGVTNYQKGKYKQAIEALNALTTNYPESSYRNDAELLLADAYFADKEYENTVDSYISFRNAHPTHAKIPYAVYMTGAAYLKQMLDTGRDQSMTRKAMKEFETVIGEFPSSEYAQPAREKLALAKDRLADQDFYIGDFYHRSGKHVAALGRYYATLEKKKDPELVSRALFSIGRCELQVGKPELAKKALTVLVNDYPGSSFASEARELLANADDPAAYGKKKKSFWSRLNPIRLFAKEQKEPENVLTQEAVIAKRSALLDSLGSPRLASTSIATTSASTIPGRLTSSTPMSAPSPVKAASAPTNQSSRAPADSTHNSASVQGNDCLRCHRVAQGHGTASDSQAKPRGVFGRMFYWLGF
jgi:outer membrane protein assembly factor BamD